MNALLLLALALPGTNTEPAAGSVRFVDVTGDRFPDRLLVAADGALSVAVNRRLGAFEIVPQRLPAVSAVDVLASDLNGDGSTDLYFVGRGENVVLLGDGTGRFREAPAAFGLRDGGAGRSAERIDLDGSGRLDVLLHNEDRDVIFWARPEGFEQDSTTFAGLSVLQTSKSVSFKQPVAMLAVYDDAGGSGSVYDIEWNQDVRTIAQVEKQSNGSDFVLGGQGWYRVTVNVLLEGVDAPTVYRLRAHKNGSLFAHLDRTGLQGTPSPGDRFRFLSNTFVISSDGDDVLTLEMTSDIGDFTNMYSNDEYHQLSIEYLGRD